MCPKTNNPHNSTFPPFNVSMFTEEDSTSINNDDKKEKMLNFIQFCNLESALGKIIVSKNCSSGIWGWRFSKHLRFWGFWGSLSYKNFYCKKNVYLAVGYETSKQLGNKRNERLQRN